MTLWLPNFSPLVLIGLGGALGSLLRYWLGTLIQARWGPGLPVGTFIVNLLGSALIVLVHQAADRGLLTPPLRLLLATGLMGGFTTYSTFNYDLLVMLDRGDWGGFLGNWTLTSAGCLLGALLTLGLWRWWHGLPLLSFIILI